MNGLAAGPSPAYNPTNDMGDPETIYRLTDAEYLDLERKAEFKSEFFDGEMFAMAGGSLSHSLITMNFGGELRDKLKGRPCVPYNSDLRLKVEPTGLYTYPDLSVICGPPHFADAEKDTVTNPTLLVEVLSDSTESYDRGAKLRNYVLIPTVREYLLVSQHEPRIEQYLRQEDGSWLWREVAGLEATLEIPSLQVSIALAEIFANVQFVPAPIRAQTPRRA